MKLRTLPFLLTLLACGAPETGAEVPLAIDLRLSWFTGDEVLQLVVVDDTDRSGGAVTCEQVTPACLADQTTRLQIVPLEPESGATCAFRVPLNLDEAQSAEGQSVSIPGIPPGKGYLVVAEMLRDETGTERVGVGCIHVDEVESGLNRPPPTPLRVVEGGGACNPSLAGRCDL